MVAVAARQFDNQHMPVQVQEYEVCRVVGAGGIEWKPVLRSAGGCVTVQGFDARCPSLVLAWLLPLSVYIIKKIGGFSQGHVPFNNISQQPFYLPLLPVAFAGGITAKGTL